MEYIITKFGLHFSIKIKHPYFNDDVCPYLVMEPDAPTKGLFKSMRLITKARPGDIKMIASVVETNEINKVTPGKKSAPEKHHYIFLIKVTDSAFFNLIDLDFAGFPKEVFYFFNTTKSAKLSSKKCLTVNNRLLRITFEEGKIPSKLKILAQDKTEIYSGDINKPGNLPGVFEYDLSAHDTGLYSVVYTFTKTDHKQAQTQMFYYNPAIRKEPIIGLIDIEAPAFSGNENDDKNNYTIHLDSVSD